MKLKKHQPLYKNTVKPSKDRLSQNMNGDYTPNPNYKPDTMSEVMYCSKEYTEILKKNDILISMTENSDPYENAVAERVNGIQKYEFGLIDTLEDFKNLSQRLGQSIYYYNHLRPHFSLNYNIPNQVHMKNNVKLKT